MLRFDSRTCQSLRDTASDVRNAVVHPVPEECHSLIIHRENNLPLPLLPSGRPGSERMGFLMTSSPARVAVISEIPTPYRAPLFDLIAADPAIDLYVLYCAARDPWRDWDIPSSTHQQEILRGFAFGGRKGGPHWKVNPSVWRRLSHLRPDVVVVGGFAHPTMLLAILWSRLHRVPFALVSETQGLTPRSLWKAVARAPVVRWAVGGASVFLATGGPAADYLQSLGAVSDRIFLFPNVPDISLIRQEALSLESRRDEIRETIPGPDGPLYLFVGRLVRHKGVSALLESYKEVKASMPTARLVIVGDGPERGALEAQAAALQIKDVTFVGSARPDDVISYYVAADCFVLPSEYEPYGVVVLEALACGLPAVVTDRVGSATDLIDENRKGRVVPYGNQAALVRSMLDVVDPADRAGRISAAASVAERWNYRANKETFATACRVARDRSSRASVDVMLVTPTLLIGGAERVFVELNDGLADMGFSTHCCVLGSSEQKRFALHESTSLSFLNRKRRSSFPRGVWSLRQEAIRVRPQVVIASTWSANVSSVLALCRMGHRPRLLLWEQVSPGGYFGSEGFVGKIKLRALRVLYPKADRVVAASRGLEHELSTSFKIPTEKLVYVPNCVDVKEVREASREAVAWTSPFETTVMAVGRLEDQKDFPTLLAAFARVNRRGIGLVIVGDGSRRRSLADLAHTLGLDQRCLFLGAKRNPFPYMSQATLFVMSSRFEGLPLVLLEAISLGLPVVATDCPHGPREVLEDGAGVLVPVGEPDKMAAAMMGVLSDRDRLRELSEAATAASARYEKEQLVQGFVAIVREFVLE